MKKEILVARGIRFSERMWNLIRKEARKVKGAKPSDVVREAVERFLREE